MRAFLAPLFAAFFVAFVVAFGLGALAIGKAAFVYLVWGATCLP